MTMLDRTIVQGASYEIPASIVDEDGNAVDMTAGTRSLTLRMLDADGNLTTKDTNTAADWSWTSQANGTGYWKLTSTETLAMAAGMLMCDVVYADSDTSPTTKKVVGHALYTVRAPRIAAL